MLRRSLLALAMTFTLANFAAAQGNDGTPPNPDTAGQAADVQELQRQITALQARVDALETATAALPDMAQTLETVANQMQSLNIDALNGMATQLQELSVAMSQIATQSGDGYNIDILGKMNSSANFREEMRRATQGRILFRNYTGVPQLVYVNGTAWNVTTGESYIDAAVGKVSTQMAYFDLAPVVYDHWKFEDGSYVLPIDIR